MRLWYFLIILHPGNIVGGAGGSVQAHLPQVFLVINLIYGSFFKENYNFSRLQRGSNFSRGGGGGGGPSIKYKNPNNL